MNLPKSWNDITIGNYIELKPIFNNPDSNPLVDTIRQVSVLTGKSIQEVEKYKVEDFKEHRKGMSFLRDDPLPTEFPPYFKIKDQYYEVISDLSKLNGAQYMSVMMILKDAPEEPKEREAYLINNLHLILTSVLRPVTKTRLGIFKTMKVDDSFMDDKADELYNHMSIGLAYPISVFFCKVSKILTNAILDSSIAKAERMKEEVLQDILKDGDGTLHSTT